MHACPALVVYGCCSRQDIFHLIQYCLVIKRGVTGKKAGEMLQRAPYHCLPKLQPTWKTTFDSNSLSHLMKLGGNMTNFSWPQSVTTWSDRSDSVLWTEGIVERNCAQSHTKNKAASNFIYILSYPPAHPLACFTCIPQLPVAVQIIQDKNPAWCLHRAPHSREHSVQASGLYQNRNKWWEVRQESSWGHWHVSNVNFLRAALDLEWAVGLGMQEAFHLWHMATWLTFY